MALITKEFTKSAFTREVTEGVRVTPSNTDFLKIILDGIEFNGSRDSVERLFQDGSRTTRQTTLTKRNIEGSVNVELTASKTPGGAPDYGLLLESLGMKVDAVAEDVTVSGSTASVINVADVSSYKVGQIVKLAVSGANHVAAIKSIDLGDDSFEIEPAALSAPAAGVVLSASTQYRLSDELGDTFTVTKVYQNGKKVAVATGARVTSLTIQNFISQQIANLLFAWTALDYTEELLNTSYTPVYDNSEPAYVQKACLFQNGNELTISEFGLTVEQDVTQVLSTCAENGAISSRGNGKYTVTATFNPYQSDDALGQRLNNDRFSLFISLSNPSGPNTVNNIGIYCPSLKNTEVAEGDADGVLLQETSAIADSDIPENALVLAFF